MRWYTHGARQSLPARWVSGWNANGNIWPCLTAYLTHTRAPAALRYALGAKPGTGMTAKGWNVILPVDVVERRFEGF